MVCIRRCLARLEDCALCKLLTDSHEPIDVTHVRETLPAARKWTLVRLVTSMSTAMDGQGAALDEGLVARFVVACIGAFIGMYSVMALEVGLSVEAL